MSTAAHFPARPCLLLHPSAREPGLLLSRRWRATATGRPPTARPGSTGPSASGRRSQPPRLWLLRRACVIRPDTNTNTHEHARTKLTRPGLSPGSAWGHVGNRTGVGRAPAASQARLSRNIRRESAATAPAQPLAKGSRQCQAL